MSNCDSIQVSVWSSLGLLSLTLEAVDSDACNQGGCGKRASIMPLVFSLQKHVKAHLIGKVSRCLMAVTLRTSFAPKYVCGRRSSGKDAKAKNLRNRRGALRLCGRWSKDGFRASSKNQR